MVDNMAHPNFTRYILTSGQATSHQHICEPCSGDGRRFHSWPCLSHSKPTRQLELDLRDAVRTTPVFLFICPGRSTDYAIHPCGFRASLWRIHQGNTHCQSRKADAPGPRLAHADKALSPHRRSTAMPFPVSTVLRNNQQTQENFVPKTLVAPVPPQSDRPI
jgi:hypothetical protein